ncbi:hypothetical protein VB740_26805 [Nostoc sp. UHCC 0251]|nr:hypothetical protein [Nostoc sp. UHCC 0251]
MTKWINDEMSKQLESEHQSSQINANFEFGAKISVFNPTFTNFSDNN